LKIDVIFEAGLVNCRMTGEGFFFLFFSNGSALV